MKRTTKNQIITIVILLIFLGSSLTFAIISAFPAQNTINVSWRVLLVILVFGDTVDIPAGIGVINETSRSELFTVNNDGIIYKQGSDDATLGDFFAIWDETFNNTCILEYCNNENNSMRMYIVVGDKQVENFEYENYMLKDKDIILIDYR